MIVPVRKSAKFFKYGGLASEDILSKKGMLLNAIAVLGSSRNLLTQSAKGTYPF